MRTNLVNYPSSDEEEVLPELPLKRRKLPTLSTSLQSKAPVDDPALHEGRTRTTPYAEGQWAAYVYVPVNINSKTPLRKLLDDIHRSAQEKAPTLHRIGTAIGRDLELHISLTRPIYLRAHQREDLRRAVKMIAGAHKPFAASFATFSELKNDEKTRSFVTFEIGAGHNEINALSDALTPTLQFLRQKTFYDKPRFHASIAWALLDADEKVALDSTKNEELVSEGSDLADLTRATSDVWTQSAKEQFPAIPSLPMDLMPHLTDKYGASLTSVKAGYFEIDRLCVRIGKDITEWSLSGDT